MVEKQKKKLNNSKAEKGKKEKQVQTIADFYTKAS